MQKKLFRKILNLIVLLVIIVVLTIIMKVFLFASFKIPTPSMDPGIIPGDYVLVNKLLIGPRLYSDLGFLKGKKSPIKRIKGFQKVKRNDILVFNFPYATPGILKPDPTLFYVKRCIAIPGDTFQIVNGIYKVQGFPEILGIYQRQLQLSKMAEKDFREELFNCYPNDTSYHWNIKYFGPLYIPGKGHKIELNLQNLPLYQNLIEYETDKRIEIKGKHFFLGDTPVREYIFEQNYYFMSGDWVFDSVDSRYWGLLPENLIVGKAALIWKSEDPQTGKFRWDRFMKLIK